MKLVRDSGRVLNGAPQFVGRPEGELEWQQTSAGCGRAGRRDFLPCQVLWRIAGRFASRATVDSTSSLVRDPSITFSSFENARPLQSKYYELQPSNYTKKRLIPTSRRQHKLLLRCCLARERFCFLLPSRASFVLCLSVSLSVLQSSIFSTCSSVAPQ